jgi:hypothetical protein
MLLRWRYHHRSHLCRQIRCKRSDYCKRQPLSIELELGLQMACRWRRHRFQERYTCESGRPGSKFHIRYLKSFSTNVLANGESYHLIAYRRMPFQAGNHRHPDSSLFRRYQAIHESPVQPKRHIDIRAHQSTSISPSSPGPAR